MDVGPSIFIRLISVYSRNKYAEKIWRHSGAATPADLWAIMGPGKCVCAHNEIYNLLQISCLGVHSKCLMP